MTTIKNIFAFLVFAACTTYVVLAVTVLPATRNAVMAITTGQAFAVAVGYLLVLINHNGPTWARLGTRLKRLTRRQVKLFLAQVTLWLIALGALAFSCIVK